eukprot:Em0017g14a
MEPYSSRVPVSLGNLRPASDPATLITPIRQDAPTHSTSCSSSHVSVPQVSYVMDSPELPHSSTQHPVQSITPQGFETGPEPARSSQSPASSTIYSPSHTPIFSHAHSPSTLTTGVPYEEALLCTTPSSSGHNTRGRKPCIVEGCREHIAPSMWRNHMNAHAKGIFAGSVPTGWLEENGLYKCEQCSQLVAKSHYNSHLQKCTNRDVEFSSDNPPSSSGPSSLNSNSGAFTLDLFTFDEVFKLKCATIRHIPAKARPIFARALSAVLKEVINKNTEEAWLKLFMLPKCVLLPSKRKGRHHKNSSIISLCKLWLKGEFQALWRHTANFSASNKSKSSKQFDVLNSAIALAKEGSLGKACKVLTSSGIAADSEHTFQLLLDKHPHGPAPVLPASEATENNIVPLDFDIQSVLRSFPKASACGPSGLRIQHLLDASEVPLPTGIGASLREVVNLLASGRAPVGVAKFLAGGSLIALVKNKPDSPPDVRPIAVGEVLRRLASKCLCRLTKAKAAEFFEGHQVGVACPGGSELIVHGLRDCIESHWNDEDFVVLKIDFQNAFNMVSRQGLLDECLLHFPELMPWASWCYGQHPKLFYSMGTLSSETGVQQGDPLGPLFFCLVLQKLVGTIATDEVSSHLLYHKWYMDDGAVAGSEKAVARVITILSELGPQLGLFLNVSKCEVFSKGNMNSFPPGMKRSNTPNMEVLGAPIGDILFCAKFVANQRAKANVLLSRLQQVGSKDPQVAYLLLRFCGSFCKMVHLARSTPPSLVAEGLGIFDRDIRRCFTECTSVDVSDVAWMQAQLSPSRGGLGLRSLRLHSSACFIASMGHFGIAFGENHHLEQSLIEFNGAVEGMEAIGLQDIIDSPPHQRQLSSMIEDHQFKIIFDHTSSPANCARLLSVSSPHASAWLSVMPTPHKNLHLDPPEFQMALKWWLGLDTSQNGSSCSFCPSHALDPLGHHALTCKSGGDSIFRHNSLRDTFWESCKLACIAGQIEAGSGLDVEGSRTRPADILLPNWEFGKPAALDFTITSALNPSTLNEASVMAGFAASAAEVRKHVANDEKCSRLGWVCIPLSVETYGCWGEEAGRCLDRLATRIATRTGCPKSSAVSGLYGRLSIGLVRANARALLARSSSLS